MGPLGYGLTCTSLMDRYVMAGCMAKLMDGWKDDDDDHGGGGWMWRGMLVEGWLNE